MPTSANQFIILAYHLIGEKIKFVFIPMESTLHQQPICLFQRFEGDFPESFLAVRVSCVFFHSKGLCEDIEFDSRAIEI